MMKLTLLLSMLSTCVFAQFATISGQVTSNSTPLEFVTVLLHTATDSTLVKGQVTDANGSFEFSDVSTGHYSVTAQCIGYKSSTTEVTLSSTNPRIVLPAISLREDVSVLNEVVVQSQKLLVGQDNDKLVLHVANSITSTGSTAMELLARAPGVSVDQNDQVSLNGKAGVTVLIDGKPTYLSGNELSNLLRSINSNSIASIEVISNPSSRYDAAGSSGIINIQLKKNMLEGWNGSVAVNGGYGRYGKAATTISLNYRGNRLSVFGNYGYNYTKRYTQVDIERAIQNSVDTAYFDQSNYQPEKRLSQNWQGGLDFKINDHNTIGIMVSGNTSKRTTDVQNATHIRPALSKPADSIVYVSNHLKANWQNTAASFNFRHAFNSQGHELTVDVDYSNYQFRQQDQIAVQTQLPNNTHSGAYFLRSHVPSSIIIGSAKSDYVYPISKNVIFEAGIKLSEVTSDNHVHYEKNMDNRWLVDEVRTNDFNYTELILAAYANAKGKLHGFDWQAGLRAERTDYSGTSARTYNNIAREYNKLFPNIQISKTFSDQYQANLTYNRRIDRPSYNDLYPFIFYLDPFSSTQGNPYLLPQFTDVVRFAQTIFKDYTLALGYSNTKQFIANVIRQDNETYTGYSIRENFQRLENFNLNLMTPLQLSESWSVNINTTLFYNRFNTRFLDAVYKQKKLSGMVNLTNTFSLPGEVSAELSLVYQAPAVVSIFQREAMGSINVGMQKSFFNKKMSVAIHVSDLFKTNRFIGHIDYQNLNMTITQSPETRIARISLTYLFGKTSNKGNNKRSTSQEDELRRLGTN